MEVVKTYSLYLNSREATYQSSGNSNNITFNINPAITLSNNKRISGIIRKTGNEFIDLELKNGKVISINKSSIIMIE